MHPQEDSLRNNRFVGESGKREWIFLGAEVSEAMEREEQTPNRFLATGGEVG